MTHRSGSHAVRLAALLTAVTLLAGCSYNKFTAKDEEVKAQWAQVENQLQRRNDLIPNLVETVKGFAKQESSVFASIADARARMAGAQSPAEKISAANAGDQRSRPAVRRHGELPPAQVGCASSHG